MYNIVLALPVVTLGVFDRDMSEQSLFKWPFFYVSGRKKLDLNLSTVVLQSIQATGI